MGIMVFMTGSVVCCLFMLLCGYFLGGRSVNSYAKNIPFESGIEPVGSARVKFSIQFYLIAMIFVIFEVEGIYIYIWAISVRELGWIGFIVMFIFIFMLLIALVYLIKVDVFNWSIKKLDRRKNIDHIF